jgi:hypothetical protein
MPGLDDQPHGMGSSGMHVRSRSYLLTHRGIAQRTVRGRSHQCSVCGGVKIRSRRMLVSAIPNSQRQAPTLA